MSTVNDTHFPDTVFLLTGIPGQEDVHVWISIPFCLVYVISILGNSFILFLIKTDPSLHEPMYIFLSMLAIMDLGIVISTMPTTLGIFWFNSREISHNVCFAQLFFIHFFTLTESSVLLCMGYDRYLAICNPLRYNSILTPLRIAKMGLMCLLRGLFVILPLPILLKRHQFCQDNILAHSYCLHTEVAMLGCSDVTVDIHYGLLSLLFADWVDFLLILLSYMIILKTVLNVTSHTERLKALNTCMSHVCIVMLFYVADFSLSIIYSFVKHPSPIFGIAMGSVFLFFPPLLNPIVYSVKNKRIRARLLRVLFKLTVNLSPAVQKETLVTGSSLSPLSTVNGGSFCKTEYAESLDGVHFL